MKLQVNALKKNHKNKILIAPPPAAEKQTNKKKNTKMYMEKSPGIFHLHHHTFETAMRKEGRQANVDAWGVITESIGR